MGDRSATSTESVKESLQAVPLVAFGGMLGVGAIDFGAGLVVRSEYRRFQFWHGGFLGEAWGFGRSLK